MPRPRLLPLALCILSSLCLAETPPDTKYALTLYSSADPATFDPRAVFDDPRPANVPGYALVRETRRLTLAAGESTLRLPDVPASLDPTTVTFRSLTAPDATTVLEQSFEYDAATPDKLLERYVGKNVIINRKPDPADTRRIPDTIEAKLLSFTPENFVLETNNKQLPLQIIPRNQDVTEIKLFDLKPALVTRPTLVWRLSTNRPGDHDVALTYQADNLTWRADYSLTVNADKDTADLSAWVTLVNATTATFPSARIKLVAGDVHRVSPPRATAGLQRAELGLPAGGAATTERPFADYHLYTLPRPVTLPANAAKQLELFPPRSAVKVTRAYVYQGQSDVSPYYPAQPLIGREPRDAANTKIDVYLQLTNSEKTGLGLPLPAGRVRVYQRDDQGGQGGQGGDDAPAEFIGEDKIDHTPKDQPLQIRLGRATDLTGDRRQANVTEDADKHTITETIELKLRNHKKDPVEIQVRETLHRWSQWEITQASDKYEKRDARTIQFTTPVSPDQEKTITYTVKYSW